MIHTRLHIHLGVTSSPPFQLFKGLVNGDGVHVEVPTRSWEASRIPPLCQESTAMVKFDPIDFSCDNSMKSESVEQNARINVYMYKSFMSPKL
jgi:hypothetical protein